jgi:IclR family transcriptional regulator, acetate operon repressor
MRTSDTTAVKSAGRTLDLLELFARADGPLGFGDVGEALGIPASSLSQLIGTLCDRGYLQHLGGRGGYRSGPALDALMTRRPRGRSLAEQAGPILRELRDALDEAAGLNVLRGDEAQVVAAEHAERELVYRVRIGTSAPLYAVAAGKALLAAQRDEEIEAYIARTQFRPLTPSTVTGGEALWRDLHKVRATGFAYGLSEASPGVAGVARLVNGSEGPVAALTVGLPQIRLDEATDERIRGALRAAADRLEASLRLSPSSCDPS